MANFTFESGMQELEDLVRALEKGDLSLEESFKAYERGIELKNKLSAILDDGDRRITILAEDGEREMKDEDNG